MLIDCDTCTVRGQGCDDCVVTVLLGAPPGWRGSDPTVVPLTRRGPEERTGPEESTGGRRPAAARTGPVPGRARTGGGGAETAWGAPERAGTPCDVARLDTEADGARPVVELDDVERRAVRALADFGLVPPLRHQDASTPGGRHVS